MKTNKLQILFLMTVLMFALSLMNCGGGGGGGDTGDTSTSGTLGNPYVLQLGQTYDIPVMGEQLVCGSTFNLTCPNFDKDYVSTKFTAPADGKYRFSVTGVAPGNDLVLFVYKSRSPSSTVIDYVATVDNLGNGGNETAEQDSLAGYYYYIFLQMWNGADTVQVKVEEVVTPPAAPSNVTVTNVTSSGALLSWQDNSNNESGFEIGPCLLTTCSGNLCKCAGTFTPVAQTGANATSYQISGLTSANMYTYAVRAYNSAGASTDRAATFTTP